MVDKPLPGDIEDPGRIFETSPIGGGEAEKGGLAVPTQQFSTFMKPGTPMEKESLHILAKQIIPIFLPEQAVSVLSTQTASPKQTAEAYVEKYPFLKGYFLQLLPDLKA